MALSVANIAKLEERIRLVVIIAVVRNNTANSNTTVSAVAVVSWYVAITLLMRP